MTGRVVAVSASAEHGVGKQVRERLRLLPGLGVEGDAHCGATVQHRSRRRRTPGAPNLRQVHLLHAELFEHLRAGGFEVGPGELGENLTTAGVALLELPLGARLHVGAAVVLQVTGLRNPCGQLDGIRAGLRAATLESAPDGSVHRLAGIMAVVLAGGEVAPGDGVRVALPPPPHHPLGVV